MTLLRLVGCLLAGGSVAALAQIPSTFNSVAVHLGGETPAGPVFVGRDGGSGGSVNADLPIGTP